MPSFTISLYLLNERAKWEKDQLSMAEQGNKTEGIQNTDSLNIVHFVNLALEPCSLPFKKSSLFKKN